METAPSTSLSDLIAPILTYKWFVLFTVLFATVGCYAYYEREPESYAASTKLYIAQESDTVLGISGNYSDARTVANQAQLLKSLEVAESVKRTIGFPGSAGALSGAVTATSSEETDFITITASGGSPQAAQAIANGFAKAFIDLRSETRRALLDKTLKALQRQRDQIPPTVANASERSDISSRIRALRVAASTAPGSAQQIDPAGLGALTSTSPKRQALFAFVLALLASCALAFAAVRFDSRLASESDAATAFGRDLLGTVAADRDIAYFDHDRPAVSPAAREAFRGLRVNLRLAGLEKPLKVILVTSANPSEGKSTLVRNLALTLHEAGQSVAIVDADLRKPSMARLLGVDSGPGLTDVLTGDLELDAAVIAIDAPAQAPAAATDTSGEGDGTNVKLTLLRAGHEPANPPAVLESQEVRAVLRRLAEGHDYVLVDTPPVLSVSDALSLIESVDGVIAPVLIGTTTRRAAQAAAELIGRVPGANFVGVVANGVDSSARGYYGSTGYGYGYGSSASDRAPAEPVA